MCKTLVVVIITSLILGAATLTRGHEWGDDFASYMMQAQSIWDGTTREFADHNSFTIFESSNQIGPIAYPWGYPLILTPVYAIKGIHPLAFKLPGLFFFGGFLACLYLLMRSRLRPSESLLLVALFAFNPLLLKFLDQILSDIPFLFFSTLALLLLIDIHQPRIQRLFLIAIVIFIACFIRTQGILLLASFIAVELLESIKGHPDRGAWQKRLQEIVIVCAIFGILFFANLMLFPEGETSHLTRYQEFRIATVLRNTGSYFAAFGEFFGEGIMWRVLYYILFVFFFLGAWIQRNEDALFIVLLLLWTVSSITWPAWQGVRFIFPLLPIFLYFTFHGMKFVLRKITAEHAKIGQWVFFSFWSWILVFFLISSGVDAYVNLKNDRTINGPFDPYSKEVYQYIQEKTPTQSVIVFFKPRVMRMMTDRDAIMSTECARILKGNYLVLNKKVGANQQIPPEKIQACHLPLHLLFENTRFLLYEIQK